MAVSLHSLAQQQPKVLPQSFRRPLAFHAPQFVDQFHAPLEHLAGRLAAFGWNGRQDSIFRAMVGVEVQCITGSG